MLLRAQHQINILMIYQLQERTRLANTIQYVKWSLSDLQTYVAVSPGVHCPQHSVHETVALPPCRSESLHEVQRSPDVEEQAVLRLEDVQGLFRGQQASVAAVTSGEPEQSWNAHACPEEQQPNPGIRQSLPKSNITSRANAKSGNVP